uniref:HupE/UreJ family protein n=1 Tax=Paracoccus sp. T5 TaxID=3402161 RepID=UPI003AE16762
MPSTSRVLRALAPRQPVALALILLAAVLLTAAQALAHNVTAGDAGYIQEIWGVQIIPFIYLGAKHMMTGYDHILFLLGVVFFLYRMKDVGIYVSL